MGERGRSDQPWQGVGHPASVEKLGQGAPDVASGGGAKKGAADLAGAVHVVRRLWSPRAARGRDKAAVAGLIRCPFEDCVVHAPPSSTRSPAARAPLTLPDAIGDYPTRSPAD